MGVLRWVCWLVTLCGLGVLVSIGSGKMLRASPVLDHLTALCEGRAQPCWYGLMPGLTDVRLARERLEALGYRSESKHLELSDRMLAFRSEAVSPGCVDVYFGYQIIGVKTVLLYCFELRIGDLLLALGPPAQRVSYGAVGEDWAYGALLVRLGPGWATNPFTRVNHLRLVLDVPAYTRFAAPWQGALPRWRYCQLEADYQGCES